MKKFLLVVLIAPVVMMVGCFFGGDQAMIDLSEQPPVGNGTVSRPPTPPENGEWVPTVVHVLESEQGLDVIIRDGELFVIWDSIEWATSYMFSLDSYVLANIVSVVGDVQEAQIFWHNIVSGREHIVGIQGARYFEYAYHEEYPYDEIPTIFGEWVFVKFRVT